MSDWETVLAQAENLEKISDRNLIFHFKSELTLIGKGGRASELLPSSVVQNLLRIGVLESGKGPSGYVLTAKGHEFI